MAIYITGDTHGDFRRFNMSYFPEQRELTRDDYMIICGDFGGVWDWNGEGKHEKNWLNWLEEKSYTTLVVDGNHENHLRLAEYPIRVFWGGRVHEIRPHVLHLMRGEYYDINETTFFTFGGARSHDIDGGILDVDDPDYKEKRKRLERDWCPFRVNKRTWWEQEMPNTTEKMHGMQILKKHDNKVDFIITHDCPASTLALFGHGMYKPDELNMYLEEIRANTEYRRWFFGHYHDNRNVTAREIMIYEQMVQIA